MKTVFSMRPVMGGLLERGLYRPNTFILLHSHLLSMVSPLRGCITGTTKTEAVVGTRRVAAAAVGRMEASIDDVPRAASQHSVYT